MDLRWIKKYNEEFENFSRSNKHPKKINWDERLRGISKAKILFLVNQAIFQGWKNLPRNEVFAKFSNCSIRWVQKVINKISGIKKILKFKYGQVLRKIAFSSFSKDKIAEIKKEINIKMSHGIFGYFYKKEDQVSNKKDNFWNKHEEFIK